ncbi:hypothetical protein HYV81_03130 [Candidatus Woesearchaeota archaeon]|nr:hypothetical protein [Candidatus Woesearchaeota archaeon]
MGISDVKKVIGSTLGALLLCFAIVAGASASLIDPNEQGFNGQSRSTNYDELLNALYASGKTVSTVAGDKMWVAWFKTSSNCQQSDLQSGSNCNSGQAIDFTHNCMVSDEFSQVGIVAAMGKDQSRMDQFYNTVLATKSTNGNIPAWRIYRNGDTIEPCKSGINGNCDTASDATARIIIALYTGAKNQYFTNDAQKSKYLSLANQLSSDFLTYEVDQTCRPSSLGQGNICYWLAGGSNVKRAGIGAWDFAYTGYYPDAIIAMLAAYKSTNEQKYLTAAQHFGLNFLQAANWDGNTFTAPPGKSFRWVPDGQGIPRAQCTNTCNPVMWDAFDASRAAGMCQANYYAKQMGVTLPGMDKYCSVWSSKYMSNPNSAPIQYYPNGNAVNFQSGYFAQGLQSLFQAGANPSLYEATVDSALAHYNPGTRTFDSTPCFGVYTQAFAVRSLGMGIGRDAGAFGGSAPSPTPTTEPEPVPVQPEEPVQTVPQPSPAPTPTAGIGSLSTSCTANSVSCLKKSDATSGTCRTVLFGTSKGDIKMLGCEKGSGYIELYQQAAPSSITWKACLANGCISNSNGFARFQVTTTSAPEPASTPVQEPAPAPEPSPTPTTSVSGVAGLPIVVKPSGTKTSDSNDGSCRTVSYSTSYGSITAKVCQKSSNRYEMYLLRAANPASICVGSYCVGPPSGFASFTY